MARRSSQQSVGFDPLASSMSVVRVRRRSASRTTCEVYNARRSNPPVTSMPLPKSILCKACKKTYPEGWKRCPYCGNNEIAGRQETQGRRLMQQRVREWEQRFGKREERPDRNRPPGSRGSGPRRDASRDRQQREALTQSPAVKPGERPASRRRRRRGSGRGAAAAAAQPPQQKQQSELRQQPGRRPDPRPVQQPPRQPDPSPALPSQESSPDRPAVAAVGEGGRRRRRFRRRQR